MTCVKKRLVLRAWLGYKTLIAGSCCTDFKARQKQQNKWQKQQKAGLSSDLQPSKDSLCSPCSQGETLTPLCTLKSHGSCSEKSQKHKKNISSQNSLGGLNLLGKALAQHIQACQWRGGTVPRYSTCQNVISKSKYLLLSCSCYSYGLSFVASWSLLLLMMSRFKLLHCQ